MNRKYSSMKQRIEVKADKKSLKCFENQLQ